MFVYGRTLIAQIASIVGDADNGLLSEEQQD